jgi:hypothetical protein
LTASPGATRVGVTWMWASAMAGAPALAARAASAESATAGMDRLMFSA